MKDFCHIELARLVGTYGAISMEQWALEMLVNSAVEPDQINKRKIMENITNVLTVPIEWLFDHTIRAKDLAVQCLLKALKAHHEGNYYWPICLGWAFHFIADWGTPHHSPTSKSNPVLRLVINAIIESIVSGISKSGKQSWDILKEMLKEALIRVGVSGLTGLITLAINHYVFEIYCDKRWKSQALLIRNRFKTINWSQNPPKQIKTAFKTFEEMMDNLRYDANNLRSNWILDSKDSEFIDYMVQIAIVMDFAYQIIMI